MKVILDENELNEKLEKAYKDGLNEGLNKQNKVNEDIVKLTKEEYDEDIEKAYQEGFEKGKAEGRLEGAVGEYSRGFSEGYKQGMETQNFKTTMPIPVPGGWSEPGTNPYPYPNPITWPQVWYSSTMTTTDTAKGFEKTNNK